MTLIKELKLILRTLNHIRYSIITLSTMTRLFLAGGAGYIGSVICQIAISRGWQVHSLSRKDANDEILKKLGVVPVRGDLSSFEVLREQSALADIVFHIADSFKEHIGDDYSKVLRIDNLAVDAIGSGLAGSGKTLVITSGSLVTAAAGAETNEESPLWEKPLNGRIKSEQYALALSEKGIRTTAIRLAPFVYGRCGSGIFLFMSMYATAGQVTYVDSGNTVTSAVHVDDAARLYFLAAKKARSGEAFNCVGEYFTFRDLSRAMSQVLDIPLSTITFDEAKAQLGEFFASFLTMENIASAGKARGELGWKPSGPSILEELTKGSYVAFAQNLKKNSGLAAKARDEHGWNQTSTRDSS